MKIAFLTALHVGGIYQLYRTLRLGLQQHGHEVRWVGSGPLAAKPTKDPIWLSELANGEAIAGTETDEKKQGLALHKHLTENYDAVFVNVRAGRVHMNVARYLDNSLLKIMIVHNIVKSTYDAARSLRDYSHAYIGVSRRIQADLINQCGFDPARTRTILNTINLESFTKFDRPKRGNTFRILSLGRLSEFQKGILWIPEILRKMQFQNWELTVAGDGPDRAKFEKACSEFKSKIKFLGRIPPSEVPALYSQHDVFLMPSRFEGFGYTIAEAMAGGCVPVVSLIPGVTDDLIRDHETGKLFAIGDTSAAALALDEIGNNPALQNKLSLGCRVYAEDHLQLSHTVNAYARALYDFSNSKAAIVAPLNIQQWTYPAGLKLSLKEKLKTVLRGIKIKQ